MSGFAPQPVMVLCSARSFSSVTTAMLGQHPELFALPEQNLFVADTLRDLLEWEDTFGPAHGYLAGLQRAVAALEHGEPGIDSQSPEALADALTWIRRRWFWRTDRMFAWLASKAARRALVHKSPRTSMARRSMHRLLACAPHARYLHLTREPAAAIRSGVVSAGASGSSAYRFFAEIWLECQRTILEAQTTLVPSQFQRVHGEDLLTRPAATLRGLCAWLQIAGGEPEIECMLHPENWLFAHAIPALGSGDNDAGFLRNPKLQPAPALVAQVAELPLPGDLREQILAMREVLGYR